MTAAIGIGALLGAALFVLVLRVAPPRSAPLVQLARLDALHGTGAAAHTQPAVQPADRTGRVGSLRSRAGGWLATQLGRRGIAYTSLRQDVALTGRTFEQALGRKVTLAGAGFVEELHEPQHFLLPRRLREFRQQLRDARSAGACDRRTAPAARN